MYEALRILKSISNEMHLVDNPFVSLEDIGAVELDLTVVKGRSMYKRSDGVIARKILRAQAKNKQWCIKNDAGINKCSCCCAQVIDKKYINECKNKKMISNIEFSMSLKK